jgi:hypothetical protein
MELSDEMIVDARKDVREIGFGIEARHFRCFDERHRVGDIIASNVGAEASGENRLALSALRLDSCA